MSNSPILIKPGSILPLLLSVTMRLQLVVSATFLRIEESMASLVLCDALQILLVRGGRLYYLMQQSFNFRRVVMLMVYIVLFFS